MGREMAGELILGGQRAVPEALESSGYAFRHRTVDQALAAALAGRR